MSKVEVKEINMEEYLDIVNDYNKITGEIATKSHIHQQGIWHREVACWIMNLEGKILVQKRAKTKQFGAGKWDITAGHIKSAETPVKAMIREIEEEIGIKVKEEELELFNIVKRKGITTTNNTFQYQYFIYINKKIEELTIDAKEVETVKYITIEELKIILTKHDKNYTFSKREYMKDIFNKLKEKYYLLQREKE